MLLDFTAGGVGVTIALVEVAYFLETDLLLEVLEASGLAVARWLEVGREGGEAETAALALDSVALVRRPEGGVWLAQVNSGGRVRLHQVTVFFIDVE